MIPITVHQAGLWYAYFYILAILVAAIIQFTEGRKRNYPIISWIIVIIIGKIFFVTGSKIITYTSSNWLYIFQTFSFPDNNARSALGGFVAFLLVFIVARYYLKYSNHFLDALTVPLLVSLAIQRIGCLAVGCCGGTICNLPWGIYYLPNSLVYNSQQAHGLINSSALNSLPIHPVQAYQILAILFILLLHFKLKKYWKAPGNSLLFAGTAYLLCRFFFEFILDDSTSSISVYYFFYLKALQWFMLFAVVSFSLLIIYREKKYNNLLCKDCIPKESYLKNTFLLNVLIAFIWLERNWFSLYELTAISAILLGLFIVLVIKLNDRITIASFRWIPLVMGICFFVLTSQTLVMKTDSVNKSYHSIGIGTVVGEYETKFSTGCSSENYHNKTNIIALDYSFNKGFAHSNLEYGVSSVWGSHKADKIYPTNENINGQYYIDNNKKYENDIIGFIPHVYWNKRFFGIGGSVGFGKFVYGNEPFASNYLPGFEVRLGPTNIVYVKSNVLYNTPMGSQLPLMSIIVASGFGLNNSTHIGLGFANNGYNDRNSLIIEGSYLLQNKYNIYTSLNYSVSDIIFSFGLRYRMYK